MIVCSGCVAGGDGSGWLTSDKLALRRMTRPVWDLFDNFGAYRGAAHGSLPLAIRQVGGRGEVERRGGRRVRLGH